MMLEECEHAMPWMNQGLQCLDEVAGREVQAGDLHGKGLQPRSAQCTKGARRTPPPRSRTWTALRAKVTEAFEPQGGRPDLMSAAKGLSWKNTIEGATERLGETCVVR